MVPIGKSFPLETNYSQLLGEIRDFGNFLPSFLVSIVYQVDY